jgi:hypothetical protein
MPRLRLRSPRDRRALPGVRQCRAGYPANRMRRKLLNLAAVLSLLLCLFTLAVRACGGWTDRSGRFHHLIGRWEYSTDGRYMGVQVVLLHAWRSPVAGPTVPSGRSPQFDAFMKRFPPYYKWWHGPFGFECGPCISITPAHQAQAWGTRTWIMVPFRALAAVTLILPVTWGIRTARRQPRNGACKACGYNLTGNVSGVCPECGTPTPPGGIAPA